ncbi:MAG TPA: hypothetical protein VHW25_03110 [Steroidobacteraceae bacterium]|nr:hypothetical protein [Steroidobacteraceae bacterium]
MSTNTVNMKVLVCALIAMAPNALLLHEFNVSTRQAVTTGQTSPTSEPSVDSSTVAAVLVD